MLTRLILILALAMPSVVSAQRQGDAPGSTRAAPALLRTEPLIKLLQAGGAVLVIRHERTEVPSIRDDYSQPTNCQVQRNLSVAGQAGSRETGVALTALGIRFGRVLSSPMCRTMETTRLIFGRADATPQLMHDDPARGRTFAISGAELRAQVDELRPVAGVNDVAMSHIGNISAAYGIAPSEGEMLVMQRDAGGTLRLVGRIIPSDLGPFARIALARAPAR